MTPDPHPDQQTVIAAALDDWWITTDPAQPFHAPDVAAHLETYLAHFGYHIHPTDPARNTPAAQPHPGPSRTHITFTVFLTLACLAGAIGAAAHHAWGVTVAGGIGAGVFAVECTKELAERHLYRTGT